MGYVKCVILSKGRSDTIRKQTLSLLPDAYVLVAEEEQASYEPVVKKDRLVLHPNLPDLPQIDHWMNAAWENDPDCPWYGEPALAVLADDCVGFYAMPGWSSRRRNDPDDILTALTNAANCAIDAGAGLFGFAANANPVIYEPGRPIKLSRWIGNPWGWVRGHGLVSDDRLTLMGDLDLSLQSLLKHRIIWCDARFAFGAFALSNQGGAAFSRSAEAFEKERAILKQKWGGYVHFDTEAVHSSERYKKGLPATTMMSYCFVPRTQGGF
jgi:hypothetical protein